MSVQREVARRGAELHERLRAFLTAEMDDEPAAAVALALLYEFTSIAATMSTTESQALAALRVALRLAEEQIAEFGVGHPHP